MQIGENNFTCLTGSCNFVVFEKFTCAYWHRIAWEIMLLPIFFTDVIHSTLDDRKKPAFFQLDLTLILHVCDHLHVYNNSEL